MNPTPEASAVSRPGLKQAVTGVVPSGVAEARLRVAWPAVTAASAGLAGLGAKLTRTRLLAPLAPHVAEEVWHRLGHPSSLTSEPFPQPDLALAAETTVTLPVQVNGKVRYTIEVPPSATEPEIAEAVSRHPAYPSQPIARLIIIPGKIVNVVLVS